MAPYPISAISGVGRPTLSAASVTSPITLATHSSQVPTRASTPSAARPPRSSMRGPLPAIQMGRSGEGSRRRKPPRTVKGAPVSSASPRSRARQMEIIVSTSAMRAGRRPSSVTGRSPAPTPRMARPPVSSSSVAAATAARAGWRVRGCVTAVPRWMRSVRPASAPSRVQQSREWRLESVSHRPKKPDSSATRAIVNSSSGGCTPWSVRLTRSSSSGISTPPGRGFRGSVGALRRAPPRRCPRCARRRRSPDRRRRAPG